MTYRALPGILSVALLLAGLGESYAQETGVLLGLQYTAPIPRVLPYYAGGADSLSRPAYRTLLISRRDGAYTIWPGETDLLIPRTDGFWRAGVKRSVYNNWVEDFVWAAPDNAPRTLAGIQPYNGEHCEGHRQQKILYAGPRYLSLEQRSAGYCEGAAHPWFFNTLAVVPIDSTSHTGLAISDVLGENAYEMLENDIQTFLAGLEDDERRAAYIGEPDAANWGLARKPGRWSLIGRLETTEAVRREPFTDVTLSLNVPASLAPPTHPVIDWASLQSTFPDAVDAFVAPGGDWLVVLRPGQLTVHPVESGAIRRAVTIVPVAAGTRAVLVQWASGERLRRWTRHFERLQMVGKAR